MFIHDIWHLHHQFTADSSGQVQEEVSSVLTCKNMQSSWGDMTGTHGAGRVTVHHRQGGVLGTGVPV